MPNINDILRQNLTDEQLAAATDPATQVLTIACAGSGKSRTLAFRIARLVAEGAEPKSIVAFTFTEKAAESIKRRVAQALARAGIEPTVIGAMYIGTIHSYCQLLLGEIDARYRQFEVLDDNRLVLYLMSRYPQLELNQIRAEHPGKGYFETIKQVASAWKTINDECSNIEGIRQHSPTLYHVLDNLRNSLRRDQFIDFSQMIRLVVQALEDATTGVERAIRSLRHLIVDEYQDINPLQEQLIQQLHSYSLHNSPKASTLFVVGDDDQAIYAWRGADVGNILSFRTRYPEASEHTLSRNFRSTEPIVTSADSFAAQTLGATRRAKNPSAEPRNVTQDFRVLWFDRQEEEAQWIAERIEQLLGTAYPEFDSQGQITSTRGLTPADFAILMRSVNRGQYDRVAKHQTYTDALTQRGIPFVLRATGGIFNRPQVRALKSTFGLLRDGSPDRNTALAHFNNEVLPHYPGANFSDLAEVLREWGRRIHMPADGARQRLYPQQLVYDLLNAFGIQRVPPRPEVMQDIGVFSRMILDVEAVYISVDSTQRFRDILNFLGNVADTGYEVSTDDVLDRPDAVTVSTVHGVKGLEFPAVFVANVRGRQFPRDRRQYEGWIPPQVIQSALDRGAYASTYPEEARLFYTAITRAERYLYVTGGAHVPQNKTAGRQSEFALRLNHPALVRTPSELPNGLTPHEQIRRVEDVTVPTNFSDIKYYLRCPREYQFRRRFGFSPSVPSLFGFGQTVHTTIGRLHQQFTDRTPNENEVTRVAFDTFHLKHVYPSRGNPGPFENAREAAIEIARAYVNRFSNDFTRNRAVEVRFEIPVTQAVITGSIDLILKESADGAILDAEIVDFKAMEGGEEVTENTKLDWRELSLQVQLYAKAARDILGENAHTGAVHLLKDNQRVDVPVEDIAVQAGVANVEWAVNQIIDHDFPMRPYKDKCDTCDFKRICPQQPEEFRNETLPPPIHIPGQIPLKMVKAFDEFDQNHERVE